MRFRYRDRRGKVTSLPDVAALLQAIRSGAIMPETQLAVGKERRWQRADSVAAYRQAMVAIAKGAGIAQPPRAVTAEELYRTEGAAGSQWKLRRKGSGLAKAAAIFAMAGVGLWFRFGRHQKTAVAQAEAPSVSGLRANARLKVYSFQFGDSVAIEQRRLQDWLASQRLWKRLRGTALKNPESLQAVRGLSRELRVRIDRLLTGSQELSQRLVTRADSLEQNGHGFDGLAGALEDELAAWSEDFADYGEIVRGMAAAMDTLPAFLLEKQSSFAMWDKEPAFLSRDDAARFAELERSFAVLAARERGWSQGLLAKRPDWMAGVLEEERPRFGRSLLSAY